MLVYLVKNTVNGKVYVGKTANSLEHRWRGHLWNAKRGNAAIHRAIRKYGSTAFEITSLVEVSAEEVNEAEVHYIRLFDSSNPKVGYNMTFGGEGVTATDEVRRQMSESHRGKSPSLETRQKLRDALKGRTITSEIRNKMSLGARGRKLSEEHRKKIGDIHRGKTLSLEHKTRLLEGHRRWCEEQNA